MVLFYASINPLFSLFPANQLKILSTNYRIGFGSFVDKTVGPYTIMRDNPCQSDPPCEATYSYRHVISLTNDSQLFQVGLI